jgi:flagellar biosynthesis protein FliP
VSPEALLSSPALPWAVLAALPVVLVAVTPFAKVSVVLGALRTGLGAEALLPLPLMLAIGVLTTGLVMAPVVEALLRHLATAPALGDVPVWSGWLDPWVAFLRRHASPDEVSAFSRLLARPAADPIVVVAAFFFTELAEALVMAIAILVPFLLVDLVAAQALALVGLVPQPLPLLTLPVKLLLFVALGGWNAVVVALVEGYR